jgi:hypothetical protein
VQIGDEGGEVPAEVNKRGLGKLGAGARLYLAEATVFSMR